VAGVRAAAGGESPLAPGAASWLVRERRTGAGGATVADLTDRERQVLRLVAAGVPNKQIARRLGISHKTVKSHLTHVFRNIGVGDRLQAARWAQRHGLAQPD
jgi:DNA-binding NarL/FixJ family response regulator